MSNYKSKRAPPPPKFGKFSPARKIDRGRMKRDMFKADNAPLAHIEDDERELTESERFISGIATKMANQSSSEDRGHTLSMESVTEPDGEEEGVGVTRAYVDSYEFDGVSTVAGTIEGGTHLVTAELVDGPVNVPQSPTASSSIVRDFHDGEDYSRIEISVKCRKLPNRDWTSKSDPFCVLCIEEEDDGQHVDCNDHNGGSPRARLSKLPSKRSKELGRTEVIKDDLNPNFTTTFVTNFIFEERQTLIVRVFDEDVKGDADLAKHDFLGVASVTLGKLMSSRGNFVRLPIMRRNKHRGNVIVQAEKVVSCNDQLMMTVSGSDLINRESTFGPKFIRNNLGGTSDPFLLVSRKNPSGEYMAVWRSEVRENNLNPTWSLRLPLQRICNGDLDRPVLFEIFDWEKNGSHKDMGRVQTTVRTILNLPSFNISYDGPNSGSSAGQLIIQQAEICEIPSMLEYTSGSCEINFMAAVDFSASNNLRGGFRKSDSSDSSASQSCCKLPSESLHFFNDLGFPNEYQAALSTIGSILRDYGCRRSAPLYGFGAKIGGLSGHRFQVPEVDIVGDDEYGMGAILEAYKSVFRHPDFEMTEPTLLAPIIREASKHAKELTTENEQAYSVLLILTDGKIDDIDQTIDALVENAADAPLSIVIVGVGGGDFENMRRLDGDEEVGGLLESSTGVKCSRDLVQFVPFRKYSKTMSHLTAETLAEIPYQLVSYFMSKGIQPNPPVFVVSPID